MEAITAKQQTDIRALCRERNADIPGRLAAMTRGEASSLIESLTGAVAATNMELTREQQTRLGLAAKLVHQAWTAGRSVLATAQPERFKQEVLELYKLLGELQQAAAGWS